MSNLSDKELDRLSREAADAYQPDEHSLSWTRLEQKLSEQMPERPPDLFRFSRRNLFVMLGSAAIVIGSLSLFILKNSDYSKHSTLTVQPASQIAPNSDTNENSVGNSSFSTDSVVSSVTVDKNSSEKVNNTVAQPGGTADIKNEKQYSESLSGSKAAKSVNVSPGKDNHANGPFTDNADRKNKQSLKPSDVAAGIGEISGTTGTAKSKVTSSGSSKTFDPGTESIDETKTINTHGSAGVLAPVVSTVALGKVQGNDSLMNAMARSKTPSQNKTLRINRSLNIGLVFGPDYTDAGGVANNQFGNNIGLTIGYYLTSKLSVNTGMIYANKFYWSPRKGPSPQLIYSPGPQQLYMNTAAAPAAPAPIEYANGASSLWEIPLTVRYDFAGIKKSKFFANAGLSSYLIAKQTSVYYSHNGNTPVAWIKTDNSAVNYWFNVVNISAGIETTVGRGFSFQFEPYLKLPMKNMGMENLKLNSYGILISIRYAPALGRSKK